MDLKFEMVKSYNAKVSLKYLKNLAVVSQQLMKMQ